MTAPGTGDLADASLAIIGLSKTSDAARIDPQPTSLS